MLEVSFSHGTRNEKYNTWQKYVEKMACKDEKCHIVTLSRCHIVMADELDPDVEYVLLNK